MEDVETAKVLINFDPALRYMAALAMKGKKELNPEKEIPEILEEETFSKKKKDKTPKQSIKDSASQKEGGSIILEGGGEQITG